LALGTEKNMRNGILAAVAMLCACSPLEQEVSRVPIPETALSVVVVRDEKGLYRYRVFENGSPVSKQRIFGGSAADAPVRPKVSEADSLVKISWSQEGLEVAFLEFDRRTGQLVVDSNLTDRPPPIERENRERT
jgi:hypothetical protein